MFYGSQRSNRQLSAYILQIHDTLDFFPTFYSFKGLSVICRGFSNPHESQRNNLHIGIGRLAKPEAQTSDVHGSLSEARARL